MMGIDELEQQVADLEEAEKAGAETDGMAERVLITKLFADVREHLDETFTAYLKGQPEELLLRAYFTVRCSDYFVEDRELPELFFEELQGYLSGKKEYGKLPSIYLLAWTKHYAREGSRKDGDQKFLAGKLLEQLLLMLPIRKHMKQKTWQYSRQN